MNLGIFEDQSQNLYPLTLNRPVYELRCGYVTLRERIVREFPGVPVHLGMRDYLAPVARRRLPAQAINDVDSLMADDCLFVNGRWLLAHRQLSLEGPEEVGLCDGQVAYARAKAANIRKYLPGGWHGFLEALRTALPTRQVPARLIVYPWHLIQHNPQAMREDFALIGEKGLKGKVSPLATVYGPAEAAFVAESAEVQPFVVLDTTHGPVFVDEEAIVFPHTRLEGPAYIGRQTQIVGGKIREGTCIGPQCRVGGEVEESIIHGYSNKYHDGFLGHSYVGEWVNLGALTTNSDLKNDYGPVDVYVNGQLMNSGDNKVGCFIGDHTKTGIGTLINTGTVIGMMSNLLASGEPLPKLIPSFCWYFRGMFSRGMGLKNMIATARAAMGRRQVELLPEEVALFEQLYAQTKEERDTLIKQGRKKA